MTQKLTKIWLIPQALIAFCLLIVSPVLWGHTVTSKQALPYPGETKKTLAIVSAASIKDLMQLPHPAETEQKSKLLTLKDAILLALRNNPQVYNSELQRINDKYALEEANYAFQPQLNIKATASYPQGEAAAYSLDPTIDYKTKFGTSVNLGYSSPLREGLPATETIGISQPILQGVGAVAHFSLLNARDAEEVNKLNFKKSVIDVVTEVSKSYRDLVESYNQLKVQQLNLKSREEGVKQFELEVKAGQRAPADLLQQRADLASAKLDYSQELNQIEIQYQEFLNTLGLSPMSKLTVDPNIDVTDYTLPTEEEAIRMALAGNIDFLIINIDLRATRRAIKEAKDKRKWQLDATVNARFGGEPDDNSYFSTRLREGPDLGLALNAPINDVPSKVGLVNARVALDQALVNLDQSRRDLVRNIINNLTNLKYQQQQIKLAENSVILQQKTLDSERMKLRYGRSTVFVVNQLQDTLVSEAISLIGVKISYLNSITDFEQLTGTTLDKWHIKMHYNSPNRPTQLTYTSHLHDHNGINNEN